ncbi:MAG: T9SS type A sorting domain-containing protein [Flavobacteriales bacterium]
MYHPFPDSNATWNYYLDPNCMLMGTVWEYYSVTYSGDTSINSQTYHKLTTPYIDAYFSGLCSPVTFFVGYRGAIRQDTLVKKVFFVAPGDTTEELLYDFTLQVGDTVQGYLTSPPYPNDTVISIDSVLIGSSYRKRWFINSCYPIYLIEGIGSTYGLIEYSPNCLPDAWTYSLTCFQQNGQTLYPNTSTTCELITSVNPANENENKITVFPNPSNGSVTVQFDQTIEIIQLTDLTGKIILNQKLNSQTSFQIDHLLSGTYILTTIDNKNRLSKFKIISCL